MRSQIARSIAVIFLLATLLAAAPTSLLKAHEGHDHGAPPTPVSSTIAPRADASSADFELVVVARDGKLTLYLDTFKGNLPVAGAALEIDAPGGVLTPREAAPGVYAAEAPFLQKAGTEVQARMRKRVAAELTTTFKSHYSHEISLTQALDPAVLIAYNAKRTGEKYLIRP